MYKIVKFLVPVIVGFLVAICVVHVIMEMSWDTFKYFIVVIILGRLLLTLHGRVR